MSRRALAQQETKARRPLLPEREQLAGWRPYPLGALDRDAAATNGGDRSHHRRSQPQERGMPADAR
jgi:hypothetical protein